MVRAIEKHCHKNQFMTNDHDKEEMGAGNFVCMKDHNDQSIYNEE